MNNLKLAVWLICLLNSPLANAATIAIWPVNPVLENNQQATAIWIENRGTRPASLQLRVFEWQQNMGEDQYLPQDNILGSPPMMTIAAGDRQLVRLIKRGPANAQTEAAYRVLIDEIPSAPAAKENDTQSTGLNIRLRYSLPLFSYGRGAVVATDRGLGEGSATAVVNNLHYEVIKKHETRQLKITNNSKVHAKISEARFVAGDEESIVNPGLLGYVLPGSYNTWNLPENVEAVGRLSVTVNKRPDQRILLLD